MNTTLLNLAALSSFIAALIHVAIIFGAGEQMASLAAAGSKTPAIVTSGVAIALGICGCYALSGAGEIPNLPFTRLLLLAITSVFMLRGVLGFVLPFVSSHATIKEQSITFWMISSTVCVVIGLLFLFGVLLKNPQ